jgi:hypothetical protein
MSIAGTAEDAVITMEKKDTLKLLRLPQKSEITLGRGGLKSAASMDRLPAVFLIADIPHQRIIVFFSRNREQSWDDFEKFICN